MPLFERDNFTAASTFPVKLLHTDILNNGKIMPVHIQISPTNVCNLNCSFCSCGDRDKKKSFTLKEIMQILDVCAERGTKAMTITGGGEPLMHPQINEIIKYAGEKNIEVGLVTNGTLFSLLGYHDNLIWCRISSSDDRTLNRDFWKNIEYGIKTNPQTDWAFSHVITENPNYQNIQDLIDFADKDFTHIRLVSNLLDLNVIPSMDTIKKNLRDDEKVIYQGRKDSTEGTKHCLISLLKPVIAPEGIFPCCGAQYAIYNQPRDMIKRMKMGDIKDLPEILDKQKYFDGSVCNVCYYSQYNDIIKKLLNKPEHINFI